jgi:hypothetical protein
MDFFIDKAIPPKLLLIFVLAAGGAFIKCIIPSRGEFRLKKAW